MGDILSALVDQREPKDVIEHIQNGLPGVPVSTTLLSAGDVWLACADQTMLVIERKTGSDLLSSIRDNRLFNQVAGMREISPWSYLVITEQLTVGIDGKVWAGSRVATGFTWNALWGALLHVQEAGVAVMMCRAEDDYAEALARLAARKRQATRVFPVRDMRIVGPGEQLLAALPGIGMERVDALLEYCGTPAWALAWLSEIGGNGDKKVPGIGPQTRAAARRALGLCEGLTLQVLAPIDENERKDQT